MNGSTMKIAGEDALRQNIAETKRYIEEHSGVQSFNGRSGSILPMAGDYDSEKILLTSVLHIGGETQENAQEALEALEGNKADRVEGAIADNFAGLDASGNLKDSGKKASDFATPSDIEQIYADNGVLGAKNLLKVTANTQTINGVTFTVNRDSNGNLINITVNGTASATAFLPIVANNTMTIEKGSYILSAGDGIVGNYSKYGLYINNASGDIANTRTEERTHFTLSADTLFAECKIFVTSGTTVSNLVFKPMIRLASDPDDTYQPHAMTNRELTEKWTEKEIRGTTLSDIFDTTESIKNANCVYNSMLTQLRVSSNSDIPSGAWTKIGKLKKALAPAEFMYAIACNDSGVPNSWVRIYTSGEIQVYQSTGSAQSANFGLTYFNNNM